jgi:multidrug resistance efflux pump
MSPLGGRLWTRRARWIAAGTVLVVAVAGAAAFTLRGAAPSLPTAEITRGEYIDIIEIRGDVRPRKSILVTAPMQAGELQILKLASNGSAVKPGDIVVQFDGATLQRTIQERESELRQAREELDQQKAQANITSQQDGTGLLHSRYNVDRAKLSAVPEEGGIISRVESEKAKLTLKDAEQKLVESEVKVGANEKVSATTFITQESKIAKVEADLERARRSLAALQVQAPSEGVVSILPNYRASSPMGSAQEFRTGDRAWAGAPILELPDLSSVHLNARLDESDRGHLQAGQDATIKIDAIPERDYHASVTDVSVLARIDFSTWPPVKQFDLRLTFKDADAKIRPGMSAMAKVVVGRLPDMYLVPPQAVFLVDGRTLVYRLDGRKFVATPVEVVKRSKEQAAIKGPIGVGMRVALTKPETEGAKK